MQFITHGPDIPDALLQAHEEGQVVFFCGAGISYPAHLPGFAGLVNKLYFDLAVTPNAVQQAAIKAGQFDTAISLLEADIVGGRERVRRKLTAILTPDLTATNATKIHEALLMLSKSRDGHTRLITTNFDRLFEEAIAAKSLHIERFQAPLLPVPKNRWDGLVYLHGLLTTTPTARELDRLVVSSGDFGLAYLTERWAARFVSELFRNYSVCFIGYSIKDPVLRYMMDALAADRLLGEATPEMFAFGSYSKGKEEKYANEWRAKNVTPILYREHIRHTYLRQTLQAWAETYRDGVQGKEAIVVKHALTRPQDSTRQDDFVGRMLWALSDKSGLPAKRFADFNPVPSLDWLLEAFSDERFKHSDLARFDVQPRDEVDAKLCFSLIRRPAPYDRTPPMLLASGGVATSHWDDVMFHLARWLTRHLDDPRLVIWIAQRGGQLHDHWQGMIEKKLDRFAMLERDGKSAELDEIRLQAPKAIPGPLMRTLWRLLLSGRVKSPWRSPDLYRWIDRLKREGLTTTLRLELRELLAPQVALKKPFHWSGEEEKPGEPIRLRQLVDWEVVLAGDHVHSALRHLVGEHWTFALPQLLEEFQQLLLDALDLMCELGEVNDRSYLDLPSIIRHWQNQGLRNWVSLIELLRDAWLAVLGTDRVRASRVAQTWFDLPYPTFKRLALFAASQEACLTPEQWVDWLLADDAWCLWSIDTRREVFRLLVLQGQQLEGATQERLESAILLGPPRKMDRDDLEPEQWHYSVWLQLAKLNSSGLALGTCAAARLAELSDAYPQWQLAANQSDEFSLWMSSTGDPDYKESSDVDIAPRKRHELVQWLTKPHPERQLFYDYEDTWRDVCKKHPLNCLFALGDLAAQGNWLESRWSDALYAWGNGKQVQRMWCYAAPLLKTMPDNVLQEFAHSVSYWIETISKSINQHEEILLYLCRRILALPLEADSGTTHNGQPVDRPVTEAINHPVGQVTRALINLWFKRNPNDNDELPADIKSFFTEICDVQVDRFRHGRVLLSSRLIAIFRVDRAWTEQYLLPLFSWDNPGEAKAVWEGFLWSPRLYQPLLIAFKPQFLETAKHYADLGEHRQQFAAFLTYAALGPIEGYNVSEFQFAIGALPQEGLEKCAQALFQALEGAADQREDFWKNRVHPFWQYIWPKSQNLVTPQIAESLTRLIIAARSEFPAALTAMQDWLQPIEHPDYVVNLLRESSLCNQFPNDALHLLDAVIADQQLWVPQELGQCLDQIVQAAPELEQDPRYLRLREYLRKRKN